MELELDITPEAEPPDVEPAEQEPEAPEIDDASKAAIAGLLRQRATIDAGLKAMGYKEPEAPAVEVDLPDGFYPLKDFGKAPSLDVDAVEDAKERLREANVANLTPKVQQGDPIIGTVGEPVPAFTNPTPPVDLNDEAIIEQAWRGSSVNDREIMVALKSAKQGNIDTITKAHTRIFGGGIREWTVRRAVYGSKTAAAAQGTLLHRGLVEQTDPMARGRIKYRLTDLGLKAVEWGGQQAPPKP